MPPTRSIIRSPTWWERYWKPKELSAWISALTCRGSKRLAVNKLGSEWVNASQRTQRLDLRHELAGEGRRAWLLVSLASSNEWAYAGLSALALQDGPPKHLPSQLRRLPCCTRARPAAQQCSQYHSGWKAICAHLGGHHDLQLLDPLRVGPHKLLLQLQSFGRVQMRRSSVLKGAKCSGGVSCWLSQTPPPAVGRADVVAWLAFRWARAERCLLVVLVTGRSTNIATIARPTAVQSAFTAHQLAPGLQVLVCQGCNSQSL